ncbi:MAG: phosphatase PAP2 family protein [Oscillospiraceae bacterium]|jgi:undecaprenyl-diphosphatase|nr:phosphatase PAP2 family protein [Oscillospiraceae bacterium]MBQ1791416.1 phosphatase PAP2 family protein [Oscillospiraceae bacterium]
MEMTAAAAWLNTTFANFDQSITTAVHRLYESCGSWMTSVMELISLLGKGGIALIVLSLVLLVIRKTRRFGTAMLLGLAIGAVVVNLWLKVVIARPRPYADINGFYYPLWQMMGSHTESDYSFPSGHTNAAFACMVPAFLLGKKSWSWLCLLFAFLMGVSRIYLVVHYPSDVLGGLIMGTIAGLLGVLIMKHLPEKWYSWSLKKEDSPKGAHE